MQPATTIKAAATFKFLGFFMLNDINISITREMVGEILHQMNPTFAVI
jgi:hypothetical protein